MVVESLGAIPVIRLKTLFVMGVLTVVLSLSERVFWQLLFLYEIELEARCDLYRPEKSLKHPSWVFWGGSVIGKSVSKWKSTKNTSELTRAML
jgi:hypothetical protein